jgi:hypothetical protein
MAVMALIRAEVEMTFGLHRTPRLDWSRPVLVFPKGANGERWDERPGGCVGCGAPAGWAAGHRVGVKCTDPSGHRVPLRTCPKRRSQTTHHGKKAMLPAKWAIGEVGA